MKSFVFSVYCDEGMRCAERAGGILDSCSDFSLIKHDIPEQSHSISGNGNLC